VPTSHRDTKTILSNPIVDVTAPEKVAPHGVWLLCKDLTPSIGFFTLDQAFPILHDQMNLLWALEHEPCDWWMALVTM
jgi:hypothetical protein